MRNFYAKAVAELKTRLNFDDDVNKLLPMIKPKNARQLSPQSLSSLFIGYRVLRDHVNEDDAESEWRAHVNLSNDYSMFRRIMNTIIWTQNFSETECSLLSPLQENPDFPI